MTVSETTTPSTAPEPVSQYDEDDPCGLNDIPDFLRRVSGDLKIELHYAYPTSTNGGPDGCYYTAGQDERRHDYATIPAALADIAARRPGAVVVFQFGGPERVDEFRHFDGPVTVASSLDGARRALDR